MKNADIIGKKDQIQDNSKCIAFKPHECIGGEYKVGHCGYFGTTHMSESIMVCEIHTAYMLM